MNSNEDRFAPTWLKDALMPDDVQKTGIIPTAMPVKDTGSRGVGGFVTAIVVASLLLDDKKPISRREAMGFGLLDK